MIEIKELRETAEVEAAREIYLEAFPVEERREWAEIVAAEASDRPGPQLSGIYFEGKIVGLVTLWSFESFVYIEHLAIDRQRRGANIGGAVIDMLKVSAGKPLLLEVEPEELNLYSQANRRIRFYQRHGFKVIDHDYIQPPYSKGLPQVKLWLMSTADINPELATQTLHSQVYAQS